MSLISFSYPYFLLLLLIVPLLVFWLIKKDNSRYAYIKYSDFSQLLVANKTWRIRLRLLPDWLRVLALTLLIIALARPHFSFSKYDKESMGIDVVLALDVSPSMLVKDFKPNHLENAKQVAKDFIQKRKTDEIGLVVFSGEAFTQCPPTTDHEVLIDLLSKAGLGKLADGTAIGDGLSVAIERIKNSSSQSKTIILLTDGVNNTGQIDPEAAILLAKKYSIRVYTIGIGSTGIASISIPTAFGVQKQNIETQIDEELLKKIAQKTKGKYFRSTEEGSLKRIFEEIDKLEKNIIKTSLYKKNNDDAYLLCLWVVIILLLESILRYGVLKIKY
ncbi:MAG: VWA domain-containing protein [Bacteroidota bacterium]|nr:VWA domain-containing protein [Bacteroidota bacterium]